MAFSPLPLVDQSHATRLLQISFVQEEYYEFLLPKGISLARILERLYVD